jgi:hypothetical protein
VGTRPDRQADAHPDSDFVEIGHMEPPPKVSEATTAAQ